MGKRRFTLTNRKNREKKKYSNKPKDLIDCNRNLELVVRIPVVQFMSLAACAPAHSIAGETSISPTMFDARRVDNRE